MNRKIINFTVICLTIVFIFFLIKSNTIVLESVSFSISIWKDNLFPTLFPFLIASNILVQYGFSDIIGNILAKPMKKIFKLPGSASYVLINSLFSGFPSGAKYTSLLVKNNTLNISEGSRLLTFTHYANPLFVLGFISIILNKKLSIIIFISHIVSGFIVGIILGLKKRVNYKETHIIKKRDNVPLGKALSISINDSLNTMFLLLGIITIFTLITSFITDNLNLNIYYKTLISGILEMTQGIKNVSVLDINNYFKTILITAFISFGGISVHMQVLSIISEVNLKYKPFFIARILHSIIAIGLVSILYYITYQYNQ